MKKITLFILALGLTMGAMAQKNGADLTAKDVKSNYRATKDYTLYPNSFNTCGSVDDPKLYFSDVEQLWTGLSGTNYYGDIAYAQVYNIGWNVPVKGIAAIMGQITQNVNGTVVSAALHSATSTSVGGEISNISFNITQASDLNADGLALLSLDLPAIQSLSDFAVVINVPEFEVNADNEIINDFLFVATTAIDCASGEKSFSYSFDSEAMTTRAWSTISASWNADLDFMIFPLINGAGLDNIDVNSFTYVYPNPAQDQVVLASSFKMEKVEIFNMVGQKVYETSVSGISTTVNVSNFAQGTYLVKMFTEAGLATKKIVVK